MDCEPYPDEMFEEAERREMANRDHFPLKHAVLVDKQEVWVVCNSSITAKGIPALMDRFYPEYTACLCSEDYLQTLMNNHAD